MVKSGLGVWTYRMKYLTVESKKEKISSKCVRRGLIELSTISHGSTPVPFLTGLSWAPNGKYLAGSYAESPRIYVWDVQAAANSGQAAVRPQKLFFPQPGTHVHTATVTDVAWSPDGRYIASASGDSPVVVWQVDAS